MNGKDRLDKELTRWFESFFEDHESLRADLLEELTCGEAETSDSQRLAEYVDQFHRDHGDLRERFERILRSTDSQDHIDRRRLLGIAPGVIASIATATVGAGILHTALAEPLYAIDKVVDRVRKAKRIYMRGTRSNGSPFELYLERPYTFLVTHEVTAKKDGSKHIVTSGHRAGNGRIRYLHEDYRDHTLADQLPAHTRPYVRRDLPIWSKIELERLLAETIGEELLYRESPRFEYIGHQEINEGIFHLFERNSGIDRIHRIFVDPNAHDLARAEGINVRQRSTQTSWQIDEILINRTNRIGPQLLQYEDMQVGPLPTPSQRFLPRSNAPFQIRIGSQCLCPWTRINSREFGDPTFVVVNRLGQSRNHLATYLGKTFDGSVSWNWHSIQIPADLTGPRVAVQFDRSQAQTPRSPVSITWSELFELVRSMSSSSSEASRILGNTALQ